jgi:hypothetical protein
LPCNATWWGLCEDDPAQSNIQGFWPGGVTNDHIYAFLLQRECFDRRAYHSAHWRAGGSEALDEFTTDLPGGSNDQNHLALLLQGPETGTRRKCCRIQTTNAHMSSNNHEITNQQRLFTS